MAQSRGQNLTKSELVWMEPERSSNKAGIIVATRVASNTRFFLSSNDYAARSGIGSRLAAERRQAPGAPCVDHSAAAHSPRRD